MATLQRSQEASGTEESSTSEEDVGGKSPIDKEGNIGLEILCGVTVALALVPEAVAFALAAGLTPSIGLHSAWIIAFFTAILGGRPAMICGATGSLAVLVGDTVGNPELGPPYLFMAVILMGVIEIALGVAQVGSLVILIPHSVMIGFCNGLAIVIGLAQFNNFKVPHSARIPGNETVSWEARRLGSFDAFTNGTPFIQGQDLMWAIVITAVSFAVCMFLPKLTTKVPSALVAVVIGTLIEWCVVHPLGANTPLVGEIAELEGSFPQIAWLNKEWAMPPLSFHTFRTVLPLAITMSAVGLLESLMTLNLVDDKTKTKGNAMRECIGQGVANMVCGVMGGMGGCAMIGQSMINVNSGARTRLSSATAGGVLLMIVLVGYKLINIIPVTALVGVMFNVVYHTFEWTSLKWIMMAFTPLSAREKLFARHSDHKIRRFDAIVILVVSVVTLFTDLAIGVGAGMLVACGSFVWDMASFLTVTPQEVVDPETREVTKLYEVRGVLFFGSTTKFLACFDEASDPDQVFLSFEAGHIADFSAIDALNKLGQRYGKLNKSVQLQQLKPTSERVVRKSAGLLVKEMAMKVEVEVLPTEREPLNVEHVEYDQEVELIDQTGEASVRSSLSRRSGGRVPT